MILNGDISRRRIGASCLIGDIGRFIVISGRRGDGARLGGDARLSGDIGRLKGGDCGRLMGGERCLYNGGDGRCMGEKCLLGGEHRRLGGDSNGRLGENLFGGL